MQSLMETVPILVSGEDSNLIAQLRKLYSLDGEETLSNAEWLQNHKLGARGAGRVLQFLGLAEQEERSCLGWKAKHRFYQIAEKAELQNFGVFDGPRTEADAIMVDMLTGIAVGAITFGADRSAHVVSHEQNRIVRYTLNVLGGLDLCMEDDDGKKMPTPLLRELLLQRAVIAFN
jgi:hypothetical protein